MERKRLNDAKPDDTRARRDDKWKKFELFLILLTAVASLIQAGANRQAIQQTQEALVLNRTQQRAWLSLEEILLTNPNGGPIVDTTGRPMIVVQIKNTGQTPALNMRPDLIVRTTKPQVESRSVSGSEARYFAERPELPSFPPGTPSNVVAPSKTLELPLSYITDEKWNVEGFEAVKNGRIPCFVFGAIVYEDVFKQPHSTRFCQVYNVQFRAFTPCTSYNDMN